VRRLRAARAPRHCPGFLALPRARLAAPRRLTRPRARVAQRGAAERVMLQLQEHPDMWTRVDAILETSTNPNSKFLALQARAPPSQRTRAPAQPRAAARAPAAGRLAADTASRRATRRRPRDSPAPRHWRAAVAAQRVPSPPSRRARPRDAQRPRAPRLRRRRRAPPALLWRANAGLRADTRVAPGAARAPAQVLEAVIKYRWMALPAEQREGIKNYVATVVIKARTPNRLAKRALRTPRIRACDAAHARIARRCRATRLRTAATARTSAS